jgi:hypothetical protein
VASGLSSELSLVLTFTVKDWGVPPQTYTQCKSSPPPAYICTLLSHLRHLHGRIRHV